VQIRRRSHSDQLRGIRRPHQNNLQARRQPHQDGLVLVLVLVFALLLVSSIATFTRRAVVDASIVQHRDASARAEALAQAGVQLGTMLLLEDRLREHSANFRIDTLQDIWARAETTELREEDGALLRLQIRDSGAFLNINSLFSQNEENAARSAFFLEAFLKKVIEEIPGPPEEKNYDSHELAQNLTDYIDADEVSQRGELEDDYYQQQDPPYRAANRALLSVAELGMVKGFDRPLVEAIEPYVTVFPYAGGAGVNPNTAPPHVLALLYGQDALDAGLSRLANEALVREVLEHRKKDEILCEEAFVDETRGIACIGIGEIIPGQIFPPPTFTGDVFHITAQAEVGEMRRSIEAVVDRSNPTEPTLLSWRVR